MLGTIVNTAAIVIGSIAGLLVKGQINETRNKILMQAIGFAVLVIGLRGVVSEGSTIAMIIALALGALIGEIIELDGKIKWGATWIEQKFTREDSNFSTGLISASLMFCMGSMAILGSFESGLRGNHEILFSKAVLDCIVSFILASSLGVSVLFSSIIVLIYQGSLTLLAMILAPVLTTVMIQNISVVGSVLILMLGINLLGLLEIKVANYLPALIIVALISPFI